MKPQYTIDLSRYNLVELECLLDAGIISVTEFDAELAIRPPSAAIVTPPDSRRVFDGDSL